MSTFGQRLKKRIRNYLRRERKQKLSEKLKFESLEHRRVLATAALQITVENLAPDGGLANTPVWVGLHNGNFDVASLRQSASRFPGLEALSGFM